MERITWGIKGRDGFVHICHDEREARRDARLLRGKLVTKTEPEWKEVEDGR